MSDSYKSTLKWYAENDPYDYDNIIKLVTDQKGVDPPLPMPEAPTDGDLTGKNVFLVIGHEPGGGTEGERKWNILVADIMVKKLNARGATVLIYEHHTKGYSQRCREMTAACNSLMPDADCVILMHYNAYSDPSANGHEFHYRSTPDLAKAFRDAWQSHFPWSRARQDNGILHNPSSDGSGMLKAAPAAACLLEPFFNSNPSEHGKLTGNHESVAVAYCEGIGNYLS